MTQHTPGQGLQPYEVVDLATECKRLREMNSELVEITALAVRLIEVTPALSALMSSWAEQAREITARAANA